MPRKNPPNGIAASLISPTLSNLFSNEDAARSFLESMRWPNGPVCPHCQSKKVCTLKPKPGSDHPVRPGVHKCMRCRKQFTVRIGTIFEESKIPLCKWLMAIHLLTNNPMAGSSRQIASECGMTQKSAWLLNHRIRQAMNDEADGGSEPQKFKEALSELASAMAQAWQKERFNRLAAEWKLDTYLSSKIKEKVAHLAYQKIIGMGPTAIPFILEDMKENGPNHWFWALHAITEENPVPRDQPGNIVAMTEAWLQWGRKKGYLRGFRKRTNETSRA